MIPAPTPAGFLAFVRAQNVTTADLPDDAIYLTWAYGIAIDTVNPAIQAVASDIYTLAVYNLGMSNLVRFAQDQTGSTFFQNLRKSLDIYGFTLGVASSASDQGTSTTYLIPDAVKQMSLADLQYLKDPWGRQYYYFAQLYTNVWGLS